VEPEFKFHIPIIFHNLGAYDAHHIFRYFNPRAVSEFERDKDEDITKYPPIVEITALNLERFISFDVFYLRFIDSVKFLNASLDSLVQTLISSCEHQFNKFVHTREN